MKLLINSRSNVNVFVWILTWRTNCFLFFQTHLTFGKEFTEAVEMKQVAQQEAERARFVVEKVLLFLHTGHSYITCASKTSNHSNLPF